MKKHLCWPLLLLLLAGFMAARAQPGGWAVRSANYQYNMTAVVQIRVNGVPNHLLSNHLALFWLGQIRGYAAPVRVNNQAFYFLNLYASLYKNDTLRFQAYIGADQKVYESASVVVFKHHKAEGKIAEPLVVDFTLGSRPIIYSLAEVDYAEGSCNTIIDVQASDNQNTEGNGLTYSLLASPDAVRFYINPTSGLVSWRTGFVPDFEMPADANGDNRYELNLRVTDANGFTAEQSITVMVKKSIPSLPLTCPQNQSALTSDDGTGNCSATALGIFVETATICQSYDLSYQLIGATSGSGVGSLPVSQTFGKGVTTVTYTQTGSNAGQCSFTVTVADVEPPNITCPANIVRGTDANLCTALVSYAVGNGDNCSGATLARTNGLANNSAFPKGITLVAYKVTDASGLTVQCSFTVTVNDTQAPNLTCPANIIRSNDANLCTAAVTYATPTATDNCGTVTAVYVSGGTTGTTFQKGTTVVQWKATDDTGLTKICTFTVTVNDTQAPNISCPTNITSSTSAGLCSATVTYTTPTATDNCTGVTVLHGSGGISGAVFLKGQTTVMWRATDQAGLTKTCSFRITVNDTQAPTIICPGNQLVNTAPTVCSSATVTYTPPTVTDNCAPTPTITRTGGLASGSAFPAGTTIVTWRAIDGSGRSATCSFAVTVRENQVPTITCPPAIVQTNPVNACNTPVTYTTPTATDNCAVSAVYLLSGLSSSSVFPLGVTTNTWRAVDVNGLSNTCSFTVTVNCASSKTVDNEQGPSDSSNRRPAIGNHQSEINNQVAEIGNLVVFPSPATSEVFISFKTNALSGQSRNYLYIHDTQGRLVWERLMDWDEPTVRADVSNWLAGIYFVSLHGDSRAVTKRLIVGSGVFD